MVGKKSFAERWYWAHYPILFTEKLMGCSTFTFRDSKFSHDPLLSLYGDVLFIAFAVDFAYSSIWMTLFKIRKLNFNTLAHIFTVVAQSSVTLIARVAVLFDRGQAERLNRLCERDDEMVQSGMTLDLEQIRKKIDSGIVVIALILFFICLGDLVIASHKVEITESVLLAISYKLHTTYNICLFFLIFTNVIHYGVRFKIINDEMKKMTCRGHDVTHLKLSVMIKSYKSLAAEFENFMSKYRIFIEMNLNLKQTAITVNLYSIVNQIVAWNMKENERAIDWPEVTHNAYWACINVAQLVVCATLSHFAANHANETGQYVIKLLESNNLNGRDHDLNNFSQHLLHEKMEMRAEKRRVLNLATFGKITQSVLTYLSILIQFKLLFTALTYNKLF